MTRTIHATETVAAALTDELMPLIVGERAALAHRCHERSISMAHLHVMSLLDEHGPLSMGHLAEQLGSGLPTATGLVTRMEERGLVERVHDTEDRRVVNVRLTEQGSSQLQELHLLRRQRLATALDQLSASEQEAILDAIRSLRAAFARTHIEGATP